MAAVERAGETRSRIKDEYKNTKSLLGRDFFLFFPPECINIKKLISVLNIPY